VIISPAIIALTLGSVLIVLITGYAAVTGIQILLWWDIQSGSDRQLALERKTYLISTVLSYVMAFELASLFLFVYAADHMHELFIGAMCAAGTLNVNDFGYPALFLKTVNFLACGVWLIVNYVDNRGYDYPLIRFKYRWLLVITGLLILEVLFQTEYFAALRPDVITSCCGAMFNASAQNLVAGIAHLPPRAAEILFYLSVVLMLRTGIHFYLTGRGVSVFAGFSLWLLVVSFAAIISFISLYIYELPTHHCPFCLIQKEYHYIGYPLYAALFCAGITGAAVGVINRFANIASLRELIPSLQKRLCLISMICYSLFTALATYPMLFSGFTLSGS
jgi:hypothetical protein